MTDVIFVILLFPIFWLPVFACFSLISRKTFLVLITSFILSCFVYTVTQNGFISCVILAVLAALLSLLVYLALLLTESLNIVKRTETTAVVFARRDLNTFAAFDGKSIVYVKSDDVRHIRLGDVVKISLNDF